MRLSVIPVSRVVVAIRLARRAVGTPHNAVLDAIPPCDPHVPSWAKGLGRPRRSTSITHAVTLSPFSGREP